MNEMIEIASKDGLMYTKWGPCFCPEPHGTCIACQNAQRIEDAGLDWDVEFEKFIATPCPTCDGDGCVPIEATGFSGLCGRCAGTGIA